MNDKPSRAAVSAEICLKCIRWLDMFGYRKWCEICHPRPASVDTLPKGQDAKQGLAGTEGSAVTPKAGDAQTSPKEYP